MLKNILILLSIVTIISSKAAGQSYKFSAGIRGGLAAGITGKYFIAENKAIEGIFSTRYRGFSLTGLYEIHQPLKEENFSFFYGLGAHVASYSSYHYYGYDRYTSYTRNNQVYTGPYQETIGVLGIDAILGLEYRFKTIPFTIGVDTKPFFDLIGHGNNYFDIAASVRYIIK